MMKGVETYLHSLRYSTTPTNGNFFEFYKRKQEKRKKDKLIYFVELYCHIHFLCCFCIVFVVYFISYELLFCIYRNLKNDSNTVKNIECVKDEKCHRLKQ